MNDDQDQDQKTEEATPRKLEQLREKGTVAKSADVSGMATAVAVFAMLAFFADSLGADLSEFAERALRLRDARRPLVMLEAFGRLLSSIVIPIGAAAAGAALVATLVQTKGLFSMSQLAPQPNRMDPIKGITKVLPSKEMLIETGKSFVKVAAVALLVWRAIDRELPRFAVLPAAQPASAAIEVSQIAGDLIVQGMMLLSVLAAGDYFLAWRRFSQQSKMAKHEIKEEHKQQEGDPHMKGKRRAKQREVAQQRGVQEVKNATCLVTNPTHISVALRYEPDEGDAAPIMLAVGVDEIALRMRTEARKHGIPILENKPLARALEATGKVGRSIPAELYGVAAKVIAHVMRIRGGAR